MLCILQVLQEEWRQEGGVQKDEGGSRCKQMRRERQADWCQLAHGDRRYAAFLASDLCTECGLLNGEYFSRSSLCTSRVPLAARRRSSPKTDSINMIGPTQRTLMVASLDGAGYALLDSGSGLTSCPINYADDLPLPPRPDNLPTLSNATGGSVECRDKLDMRTGKLLW